MATVFSREQAEQALPHIAPLLWELKRIKGEHDTAQSELDGLQATARGNGHAVDVETGRATQRTREAAVAIQSIIDRVQEMGAEVKDIEMGLVDFRSRMEGREVYLCWKLGEEHIEWWHDIDSGYASRQRLD